MDVGRLPLTCYGLTSLATTAAAAVSGLRIRAIITASCRRRLVSTPRGRCRRRCHARHLIAHGRRQIGCPAPRWRSLLAATSRRGGLAAARRWRIFPAARGGCIFTAAGWRNYDGRRRAWRLYWGRIDACRRQICRPSTCRRSILTPPRRRRIRSTPRRRLCRPTTCRRCGSSGIVRGWRFGSR